MRSILFIIVILISCRSIDIDPLDLIRKNEIRELENVIQAYRSENGNWPTSRDIDNLKRTNIYLKRFSKISLTENSDSISLNITSTLQYEDFEDAIRSLEFNETVTREPNGQYFGRFQFDNVVLQDNIQIGRSSNLTRAEKKQIRKWNRLRIETRQLTIENTITKEKHNIKVGTPVYFFSQDTTLVMTEDYSRDEGIIQRRVDWIICTINSSDSTLNIDRPGRRRLVKFSDIDSLGLKSQDGRFFTFRIVGVHDTAPHISRSGPPE